MLIVVLIIVPEGHCIFKVDQRNAFNCANRAAMLDLIARARRSSFVSSMRGPKKIASNEE